MDFQARLLDHRLPHVSVYSIPSAGSTLKDMWGRRHPQCQDKRGQLVWPVPDLFSRTSRGQAQFVYPDMPV